MLPQEVDHSVAAPGRRRPELESLVQNLIGIVSLPAVWQGGGPSLVLVTLLDVLIEMLDLDFACAKFAGGHAEVPKLSARVSGTRDSGLTAEDVGRCIFQTDYRPDSETSRHHLAGSDFTTTVLRLDLRGQTGELIAGSIRNDFPTTVESVLMRIAANQAAIGLQEALSLGDQKRRAEELEREIADRTTKLRIEIEERIHAEARLKNALSSLERSQESLRRNDALFRKAQRLSSTGSWYWRVTDDVVEFSDETRYIYELDLDEPVTLRSIAERIHPEDQVILQEMVEFARDHGKDLDYEYRAVMPDGRVKHLHLVGHGARDKYGDLEYIGAVQDVTQQHKSREDHERTRSELAHAARVASLGALTASIAHEIKQPLTSIQINAATCMLTLESQQPDIVRVRELVQRTMRDGKRASEVIERLRTLLSKKQVARRRESLNGIVQEVIALSAFELQRSRVRVRLNLSENDPSVMSDRVQLQQVILNLVLNSRDALVEVEDARREISIATSTDGVTASLNVEDMGVGIDAEALGKLFEAFYSTKSSGMGLGLWVSRSIIESHGGSLSAAQREGGGARFSFTLRCTD